MKKYMRTSAALAAVALTLVGCSSEIETESGDIIEDKSGDTLAEVVANDDSISIFSNLLESTGVARALEGEASYTLLAPSDKAMEALGGDAVKTLSDASNGAIAAAVIREHMVPGSMTEDAVRTAIEANGGKVTVKTFGTNNLTFALDGEVITVSGANGASGNLIGTSTIASNGAVMTIDAVLTNTESLLPVAETAE